MNEDNTKIKAIPCGYTLMCVKPTAFVMVVVIAAFVLPELTGVCYVSF